MSFTPNPAQAAIIDAPAAARLVVDAGPGTGKTATAAARTAALLVAGMAPGQIVLVSFTRAAVLEMRQRLDVLELPLVTTLDSLAWQLRQEDPEPEAPLLEGYDGAIAETLASLRRGDAPLLRQLAGWRHVLIDETQDLVGERALLVSEILAALPGDCGITLLTDEAQAIYGFASSALSANFTADTVAQHCLETPSLGFSRRELGEIHRTRDQHLLRLFAAARAKTLRETTVPGRKLARLRRHLRWRVKKARAPATGETLILYRSRAEVLHESQALWQAGIGHRLRLSGLPVALAPWLAITLHDFTASRLHRDEFLDLCGERLRCDGTKLWDLLSPDLSLDVARLHKRLAAAQPPPELCCLDPGDPGGPILGTIHASKGREMRHVQLMLPAGGHHLDDPEAEARVLFVAATRAKEKLEIGHGPRLESRRLPSGRAYILASRDAVQVEIGRPDDFDFAGAYQLTPNLHDTLQSLPIGAPLALGETNHGPGLLWQGQLLGLATRFLQRDLGELQSRLFPALRYRPVTTAYCAPAHFLGLRSIVIAGHNTKSELRLAPLVSGMVLVRFSAR
jgi:hypothetical protein